MVNRNGIPDKLKCVLAIALAASLVISCGSSSLNNEAAGGYGTSSESTENPGAGVSVQETAEKTGAEEENPMPAGEAEQMASEQTANGQTASGQAETGQTASDQIPESAQNEDENTKLDDGKKIYWFTGLTAQQITDKLSLKEKVRQMLQSGYDQISARKLKKWDIGSVFGSGDGVYSTQEEWRKIISDYQTQALASKTGLPIIYGLDDIHGIGYCSGAVIFPHNIGLGAANDPHLMYDIGSAVADEAKLIGALWNFSPCIAVSTDPRWGRTYESYSSDPEIVEELGRSYTRGMVENGLVACAKHFFADGSETWGTGEDGNLIDRGDAELTDEQIQVLLDVYKAQIGAGVQTIMLSHGSVNGVKMHGNAEYIRVLREDLGFDGMIVSDYESIQNIEGDTFKDQLIRAINAGVDMLMEPNNYEEVYKLVLQAVKEGSISEERIDDAVRRIIQTKIDAGIMDDPMQESVQTEQTEVGSSEYRELAERAVEESQVLLKNEDSILPLKKGMKVYVTGPAADNDTAQCGGWTREWTDVQGSITGATTILKGLEEVGKERGITILTDPDDASDADATLLFVGETTYAEWFGDSEDIELTGTFGLDGNEEAIEKAERLRDRYGIPTIACMVAGRQVIMDEYYDDWDAAVMCYLPGTEGQGVANVLMGKAAFQGKLPMPWYESTDQIGTEDCMFPVGYGLETKETGLYEKGEEIPVTFKGRDVRLGETTLNELWGKEADQEEIADEEDGDSDSYTLTLMTFNGDDEITADINNGKVYGLRIDCSNEEYADAYYEGKKEEAKTKRNELVTIGGVCIGDTHEEIENAFGAPKKIGSFNDGFGTHIKYEFEDGYKLVITAMGGAIDSMSISLSSE